MTVELAFAQARKVLPASQNLCRRKTSKKFTSVGDSLPRIRRNRSRPHHAARGFECKVKHRCEIHVEAQRPAIVADNAAVLAESLRSPVANTSPADGVGPSASRNRSTVPPSRSTHVKSGVSTQFWHSRNKVQ